MYEGTPDTPRMEERVGDERAGWHKGRLWDIIERYGVTQFYTAPTAIRTFMKWGEDEVEGYDLSTLRVIGTVGEPINPEAWMWYHENIGKETTPIVDTWFQTETGSHVLTPLPGVATTKPGSAVGGIPGTYPELVDDAGNLVTNGGGYLTLARPWPSMLRGIWGDEERFEQQYWATYPGNYLTGDNARLDDDGYYWIMGRIDDVINVSGHRLSTIEVESALVSHPNVAECAAVGRPHDIKGQAIAVFVTVKDAEASEELRQELRLHVRKEIGALAVPDDIRFTEAVPKTRSGKIMRRLLRDIAAGREAAGDTSTLEDFSVLAKLRENDDS